ncbi:MAG: glutamate-5-semialdehyde dehydrogenase [Kiritimatiellaeota bacterium]|nr:glutamate-5-semialdehyde dehydrogenase [Kiritimatiellota bacterium]
MSSISAMARAAKTASVPLAAASTEAKNQALAAIAAALDRRADEVLAANREDIAESETNRIGKALLKRLKFDRAKLDGVLRGLQSLISLPDPVGRILSAVELDRGLELHKVSCPIGVIGVVFESRPDALVQISSLCLKSGNAVLLKGGSEARRTNRVLADTILSAGVDAGMPSGWLQLLETRADVNEMLALDDDIDLLIPRGSNQFVRYIMDHTRIPVLGHADGICHVYVDRDADPAMAEAIVLDSKCQYVAVCNALETLLVHAELAETFLPRVQQAFALRDVELLGCPRTREIIDIAPATEEDWRTEYLDYRLSIRVVPGLDAAIAHINEYGSGHTDAIVTRDATAAERFMDRVDSANVFWNCSTRFSDGFRYGLGAEVGISTNKIHARGPVGLEGLTIYKWKLRGHGHVVDDYARGGRRFTHRSLGPAPER